jgi:hypothetical protein
MFFIELMAARYNVFGHQAHDLEAASPTTNNVGHREKYSDSNTPAQSGKLQTLFLSFNFKAPVMAQFLHYITMRITYSLNLRLYLEDANVYF